MTYFKKISMVVLLLLISTQFSFAFYSTEWKDVYNFIYEPKKYGSDVNQVFIDLDSVNIHNDSIYFAVKYVTNTNGGVVAIMQSKNNKVGTVETYTSSKYETIMSDHISYPHPAYTAGEAKEFKTLDNPEAFMYKANEYAKTAIEIKKIKPYSSHLSNGLYGI